MVPVDACRCFISGRRCLFPGYFQAPFAKFADATKTLEQSADQLANALTAPAKDRLTKEVVAGSLQVNELLLEPAPSKQAGQKYDYLTAVNSSKNAPYLLKLAMFRAALKDYNQAISSYAASLQTLASGSTVDDAAIDKIATDANSNLRGARDTLATLDPSLKVPDQDIAIFSTVAIEAFRAYQRSIQREALLKAMRDVDSRMPAISKLGVDATTIIADAAWAEYQAQTAALTHVIANQTNPAADRSAATTKLLKANLAFPIQLAALKSLHDAYAKLPEAHAQMIQATQSHSPLDALEYILTEAKRIDTLYESLKAPAQ